MWTRDMAEAHLRLQGWYPIYTWPKKMKSAAVVLANGERWFHVSDRAPFAAQTGIEPMPRADAHEHYWDKFTDAQLVFLIEAMQSYGVLHDANDT